eukprot:1480643-Pleurochrysis_carterae.AAC.1
MDVEKNETYSQPSAAETTPMGTTETDTESSLSEDVEIIRVRAGNAPSGSMRTDKGCAVTGEDLYIHNSPTGAEDQNVHTDRENAEVQAQLHAMCRR